jgi:uncharacterized membrane protein (UPF0127 family)
VIREAQVWDETGREVGRFQVCARPLERLRGLMFRRDLPVDGLLFVFPAWRRHPRAVGIHTFFVFFPFAAIWLDEEGRIVHAVEARPFRAYAPPRPARYLIEGRPDLLARARVGARWRLEIPEIPAGRDLLRGELLLPPEARGPLWLEMVLAELEALQGRPPELRDLLRGLSGLLPRELLDPFWGLLARELRAISRDGRRGVWAARLGELLREAPDPPEGVPRWLRRGIAVARAALGGLEGEPDEAVACWRGLEVFERQRGLPWTRWRAFRGFPCAVCGRSGGWLRAFPEEEVRGVPAEAAWRLRRPEAFAPLCDRCRKRKIDRRARAQAVWGPRFAALARWLEAARSGRLPADWDRRRFPLWPPEYGGRTWEDGSPAFPTGAELRPPNRF